MNKIYKYCYDVIRYELKLSSFLNLNHKDNLVLKFSDKFALDNAEILKVIKKYERNKNKMQLLYAEEFIMGDELYSPLRYKILEFEITSSDIKTVVSDDYVLNVGAISLLLNEDLTDISYNVELLNKHVNDDNFVKLLRGISERNFEVKNEKKIILATLPKATAGILSELSEMIKK